MDGTPLVHAKMCQRLLEHINALMDRDDFDPAAWRKDRPYLFEKAVEIWIKLKPVSYETLEARERIAQNFLIPFFKGKDIRQIRRTNIDEFHKWLTEQGLSDKYIYNIIGELRACLRFHSESIPRLPTFPVITFQEKPIQWLTQNQQDKVFDFIPEQDRPIFTFQRFMGCRPNEARGLLRENIHRDKGIIVISTVIDSKGVLRYRTNTKRMRVLPIVPEIEDCLKLREVSRFVFTKKGMPYVKRTHEKIWHTANLKAHEAYGVPIVSMYPGTKHSFGMNRLKDGFSKDILQAIFGHVDKKSTERYAKYLTESLAPAIRGKVIPLVEQKAADEG
jgi:integrase